MANAQSAAPSQGPRIGAHVSTAGHIDAAVERAQAIEAEAVQIFGAAPQQWRRKVHPPDEIAAFRDGMAAAGIGPNFMHGIYLVNLASPDGELVRKSVEALIADMRLAASLGVAGVIFHVGSHLGAGFEERRQQIVDAMREVLDETPDEVWLCIENNAGTGNSVGSSFSEIASMMSGAGGKRVKVCLDTCHAHSAGYNLVEAEAFEQSMEEFEREIGGEQLVAVHANDSKTPFGSGRDRHENISHGSIGLAGFENLLAHETFRSATWLLEVPGFEGGGPDKLNVRILKALRDGGKLPRIPRPKADGKATKPVAQKAAKKAAKKAVKKARPATAKRKAAEASGRAAAKSRAKAAAKSGARKAAKKAPGRTPAASKGGATSKKAAAKRSSRKLSVRKA